MAKNIFCTKEEIESVYLAQLNGKWQFPVRQCAERLRMSCVTLNKLLNFYKIHKRGKGNLFVK